MPEKTTTKQVGRNGTPKPETQKESARRQKLPSSKGKKEKPPEDSLTHEQLHAALFWIEEIMERAMLPFSVLGKPARCIFQQQMKLQGKNIKLAVKEKHLTRYSLNTLRENVPEWNTKEGRIERDQETFVTEHKEVPVIVRVLHKDYTVFKNPDKRFYSVTELCIPNPFEVYWEKYKFLR